MEFYSDAQVRKRLRQYFLLGGSGHHNSLGVSGYRVDNPFTLGFNNPTTVATIVLECGGPQIKTFHAMW